MVLRVLIFLLCFSRREAYQICHSLIVRRGPTILSPRYTKAQTSSGSGEKSNQFGKAEYEPTVPVAMNGGDLWVGWRVTPEELEELVEAATSTVRGKPVMKQFHPRRDWLWRQWDGTIVRSVMFNEVKLNMAWALISVSIVYHILPRALLVQQSLGGFDSVTLDACRSAVVASLKPIENFWALTQTLVAFVLSFFLSQTYAVWREVYSIARKIQGRLSDLGLLLATNGERDLTRPDTPYSTRAIVTMEIWARYARLFNMLFFASVTRRFAPLATPKGLQALNAQGAITSDEVKTLLATTSYHQTVCLWMSTLIANSIHNGAIQGASGVAYQCSLMITNLRAHYGQMGDALSGRMNLAYTHLVQLFVDMLCLAAPLALVGPLGAFGAIIGTAAVTLFYAGVLALAKMFLDPFDNEDYGGRSGIRLEADTLVQEVNANTRRWVTAARDLPKAAFNPMTCVLLPHQQLGLPLPTVVEATEDNIVIKDLDDVTSFNDTTIERLVNTTVLVSQHPTEAAIFEDKHKLHNATSISITSSSTADSGGTSEFATTKQRGGNTIYRAWRADPDDPNTVLRAVPPRTSSYFEREFADNDDNEIRTSAKNKLNTLWTSFKRRLSITTSFLSRRYSRSFFFFK